MNHLIFMTNYQEPECARRPVRSCSGIYPIVSPYELKMVSPFKDLLPPANHVVFAIAENMMENGYDMSRPIVTWAGHDNIVIDGHLRLRAAILADLDKVCVMEREFESEDHACIYALESVLNRRHDNGWNPYLYKVLKKFSKRLGSGYLGAMSGGIYE